MRRLLGILPLLALSSCTCQSHLHQGSQNLVIVQPTTKQGALWVMDFGLVQSGQAYSHPIVVQNTGTGVGHVTSLHVRSGSDPGLTLTGTSAPAAVDVNQAVTFTVSLSVGPTGSSGGYVDLTTDDPLLPTATVQVTAQNPPPTDCALQFAPNAVAFGSVPLHGTAQQSVIVTNTGKATCVVQPPSIIQSSAFTIVSVPPMPANVLPGTSFTVKLQYQPTGGGVTDNGLLVVPSNDPVNPQAAIALSGSGLTPLPCQLWAVPNPVAFAPTPTGQVATQTLSLYNYGPALCTVLTAGMKAGSSKLFAANTVLLPYPLSTNAKTDFTITFGPAQTGTFTGTLSFTAVDTQLRPYKLDVPISATAAPAKLCLTPTALNFGTLALGATNDQTFDIQNCGTVPLEVRGLLMTSGSSSAFAFNPKPTVPATLAPGASMSVDVRYAPKVNRPDFGQVQVLNDDPTQSTALVSLQGNVTGNCTTTLSCSPNTLTFPQTNTGQSSTQTVTCVNLGSTPVTVSSIQPPSGAPAGTFIIGSPALPAQLAVGQQLRFGVQFAPTTAATYTGNVTVDSTDCRTPNETVAISAQSVTPNYPKCLPPTQFQPVVKWSWTPSTSPTFKQVFSQPLVSPLVDTNGDGLVNDQDIPAVIFASVEWPETTSAGNYTPPGVLRAVRGDTGAELWTVTDPNYQVFSTWQGAVGDIDGDNIPEVVTGWYYEVPDSTTSTWATGRLVAFNNDGTVKWLSDWWTRPQSMMSDVEDDSSVNIADLDGDGVPEIITGSTVFDANGRLLWQGQFGQADMGHGTFSVVADLNGDGRPEVVAGTTAYFGDGGVYWNWSGGGDGLPVVVDVDGDGKPEVVLRNDYNSFVVLNANGTTKYGPFTFATPEGIDGGTGQVICASSITAADFDGDGLPEIGIPAGNWYHMFKPDGTLMWSQPIEDYIDQCGASGTGAYDFAGKGWFDAVYNDAEHLWVFDGHDGGVIYQQPRNSVTIFETPVIADIDKSGHASILVTQTTGPGLQALSNTNNDWSETRHTWNEYAYHVTNVDDSANVPLLETPSWKVLNAYRANQPLCTH